MLVVAEKNQLGLTARIWLLSLSWRLGFSKSEATQIYERGLELARICGDEPSAVLLTLCYALHCAVTGDYEGHYRHAAEACRISDLLGVPGLWRASRLAMINSLSYQGRLQEALELTEGGTEPPDDRSTATGMIDDALSHRAYMFGMKGLMLAMLGRIAEAGNEMERAQKIVSRIQEAETRGYFHAFWVHFALCKGDRELALQNGRDAARLAEDTGIPLQLADAYLALGSAQILDENWEAAKKNFEHALQIVQEHSVLVAMRSRILLGLAQAHLGLDEARRALGHIEEMLEMPEVSGMRTIELSAHLVHARALLRTQGARAAESIQDSIAKAIALVDLTGAEAYRPDVHLVLAELAEAAGDAENHRAQREIAHRLYVEVGATGHAQKLALQIDAPNQQD